MCIRDRVVCYSLATSPATFQSQPQGSSSGCKATKCETNKFGRSWPNDIQQLFLGKSNRRLATQGYLYNLRSQVSANHSTLIWSCSKTIVENTMPYSIFNDRLLPRQFGSASLPQAVACVGCATLFCAILFCQIFICIINFRISQMCIRDS